MGETFEDQYFEEYGLQLKEPEDSDDVKRILAFIRMRHGFLDEQDEINLQNASADIQRKMRFHAKISRSSQAKHTRSMCNQLYTDPFRFLYEVIQNADDAEYSKAQKKNEGPFLKFIIKDNELIIDTNEDGFTLADVKAICTTGASSKIHSDITTGEKGFGFKAVFGIASKVCIQSGLWSFFFLNAKEDDGIGMISPGWNTPCNLPEGVRTRFVLSYDFPDGTSLSDLCTYIEEQPVTIMSFLRRLKRIEFDFEDKFHDMDTVKFEKLTTLESGQSRLIELRSKRKQTHCYLSWLRTISDMPPRTGRLSRTASIVVNFPVKDHENYEPVLDPNGEHIFAYLPVNQIPGLPFIIQADFILPASRQDVVINDYNRRIRKALIDLFVKRAEKFASDEDGKLRCSWLKFIPQGPMPGIWANLSVDIAQALRSAKAFLGVTGTVHTPGKLRIVPPIFTYGGEPLLENKLAPYTLLASSYSAKDVSILRKLGVSELTPAEMLDAVISDSRSGKSKVRSTQLSDEWHDKYMSLLQALLNGPLKIETAQQSLQKCRIFPLLRESKLEWDIGQSRLYLPQMLNEKFGNQTIQLTVPTDLGITTLHTDAVSSTVRKNVYVLLGAERCDESVVREKILSAHKTGVTRTHANLLAHLEILFWYGYIGPATLRTASEGPHHAFACTLYFQSSESLDADMALELRTSDMKRDKLLKHIYHISQMQAAPSRKSLSWMQWLEKIARVRWHLPLQDPAELSSLHRDMLIVLKEYPEKFLPMLQAHWSKEYASICRRDIRAKDAVLDSMVPCLGDQKHYQLRNTLFPTKEILDLARFYKVDSRLGILDLSQPAEGVLLDDWSSLRELGIEATVGLEVYKKILTVLAGSTTMTPTRVDMEHLYKSVGSCVQLDKQTSLQEFFAQEKLIWDPNQEIWVSVGNCVWESKVPLLSKSVMATCYTQGSVKNLFQTLLQLSDSTLADYVMELQEMSKDGSDGSSGQIYQSAKCLYAVLLEMASGVNTREEIRNAFKGQKLILANGGWLKISKCVWHESVSVGGHVPIKKIYTDLQDFFVGVLGVKKVSDTFMMNELATAAKKKSKDSNKMKDLMMNASTLLPDDYRAEMYIESLETLRNEKFLPCRLPSGSTTWLATDDDFLIPDDKILRESFRDKVCTLDVTYEQWNTLHKLLSILGLEKKYLRRNVEYRTEEGECILDEDMTKWFQECAFAISSCAVYYHSPLYANQKTETHDLLRQAIVQVSPNMQTVLVTKYNGSEHKVPTSRVSLKVSMTPDSFTLTLPKGRKEQESCMELELPKRLSELLQFQEGAANTLYRIINKVDVSTDRILEDGNIPGASWLFKTQRVPTLTAPPTPTTAPVGIVSSQNHKLSELARVPESIESIDVRTIESSKPDLVTVPVNVNEITQAPKFTKVLEHVLKQATGVRFRNARTDATQVVRYEAQKIVKSARASDLFGSDEYWKQRIGAAGEFMVFRVLQTVLGDKISVKNWPSTIRHLVGVFKGHEVSKNIKPWNGYETSDLAYQDMDGELLSALKRTPIGDHLDNWMPEWLSNSSESLEWHFEVKTTPGPCERSCYMSKNQYDRMREAGQKTGSSKRKVYCIVRVYNLCETEIGFVMLIDPWRFREKHIDFDTTDQWLLKIL